MTLHKRSEKAFVALSGELPDDAVLHSAQGVGLIRSEYIVRASGAYWTIESCRRRASEYVTYVLEHTRGKQVWYRLSDLEARDVNVLEGCDVVHNDDNPILGPRGLRRARLSVTGLDYELKTFAALSQHWPRLGLLLPFCKDAQDVAFGIAKARDAGHLGPIGVMLEIPAAVQQAREIMGLGVDYCLIGLNDLTGLMLGTARTAPDFDHAHPAVVHLVRLLHHVGAETGIPVRVAGNYGPDLIQALPELPASSFVVHYSDWSELADPGLGNYRDMNLMARLRRESDDRLVAAGLMDASDVVIAAGIAVKVRE
jgi:phosphoenolpyruvate-protein kinase (PTS system EI component)